jgi:biofilm PGA synthesis lipoprotein PgaB
MDWRQVRSVAANPLVTIASHSFDLHKAIPYNPQSNTAHAAVSRAYDRNRPGYETETEYVARLREDFGAAKALFAERLGRVPEFLAWPYGEANAISTGLAGEAGYKMAFLLRNRTASVADLMRIDRWVIAGNPAIQDFIEDLAVRERHGDFPMDPLRGVQVDLDLIYDPSPVQTEKNLGRFLERIATIRPNTVVLQAFADPDGDGNVDAVYFPNRVLPVRADLLNRVANQLYVRGFRVFVWMPVLAVTLPDPRRNASLLVRGRAGEGQASSAPEYRRLSPFAPETETIMATLYDDLAAHVRFDGLLFQDDAFLRDDEDMHPAALAFCGERLGFPVSVPRALTDAQRAQWTRLKTRRLNDLTLKLMQTVRRYRPDTVFARDLYIKPLEMPASEEWFAQNYDDALALYDLVVLMAFPRMEGVRRPLPWLERLADRVAARPRGLEKTVFNLQSYDWRRKRWLSDAELLDQTRTLMARGVRHVVYYPDDYTVNKPAALAVRREYSTTHFLFPKPPEKRTLRRY